MTFTEQLAENLLELARVKVENARLKTRIKKLEAALRRIIGTIKLTVGMNPDYASTQKECKVEAEEALR